LTSISKEQESKKFQEAITNPDWLKAMKEELKALEKNKTWEIIEFSRIKNPQGVNEYIKLNIIMMVS
jgi:hypothetical protein